MLTEVDKSTVPIGKPRSNENIHFARKTVNDFVAEGFDCAKVTGWPRKIQPATETSYLNRAVSQLGYRGEILVRNRDAGVYLIWVGEDK